MKHSMWPQYEQHKKSCHPIPHPQGCMSTSHNNADSDIQGEAGHGRSATCCEHWSCAALSPSPCAAGRSLLRPLLPALFVPLTEPVRVRLCVGDLTALSQLCPEAASPAVACPRLLSCLPALPPPAEPAADPERGCSCLLCVDWDTSSSSLAM